MNLQEAQESLKRKGYTSEEIDIWTAGYNCPRPEPQWVATADRLPAWVAIETVEDLPKEDGVMTDSEIGVEIVAWMPVPPPFDDDPDRQ